MHSWRDVTGVFLLWLAFMAVVAVYVVRIGILWREQRLMERFYRLQLAKSMRRAVRETSPGAGDPRGRSWIA
jgi:hypothetical protein